MTRFENQTTPQTLRKGFLHCAAAAHFLFSHYHSLLGAPRTAAGLRLLHINSVLNLKPQKESRIVVQVRPEPDFQKGGRGRKNILMSHSESLQIKSRALRAKATHNRSKRPSCTAHCLRTSSFPTLLVPWENPWRRAIKPLITVSNQASIRP